MVACSNPTVSVQHIGSTFVVCLGETQTAMVFNKSVANISTFK